MALQFKISVKPGLIGKQDLGMQLGRWEVVEMTPRSLAQWCYFNHTAYCHGVFDNDRFDREPLHYHTARANHFFLEASVITVDVDSKDFAEEPYADYRDELIAAAQLDKLLEIEFVRKHCFLIVPSSGNKLPDKPNWHLSFLLNKPITSPDEYREVALTVAAQIPLPTDHQTAKAAQLTAGTLYKDPERHAQGYHWEDLYVNDDAEPIDPTTISRFSVAATSAISAIKAAAAPRNYGETEIGSARSERHYTQPAKDREKIVLECLRFVLPKFSEPQDYEFWTQVWMSAWDGSVGADGTPSERVRDYILDHPDVVWSDGNEGKRKFYHTWNTHTPRQEGSRYTVASLFYLAIREGWLRATGYEIPDFLAEKIDVEHISDWLAEQETVPERVILQSQTGSGKTETLIQLWHRLNKPKTVVFVPTVKLAIELAGKLTRAGLPAVLYIDRKGKRLNREDLLAADVLVTTLQTFAVKAEGNNRVMHHYGLVYVEECDQLFAQFARGGGSALYQSSHVSEQQARAGFITLQDALANSGVVWMVDATMTRVTLTLAENLSSKPTRYVLNTNVRRKQPVWMLSDLGEAYALVLDALNKGRRVVVAADKASRAKEITETMLKIGVLDGKRHILLTKDTESQPEVQEFMEDVEAGAAKYDFVAYNSVMASGVSIQKTTPDLIVQFCEYLTPRNNLQILNRYRSQRDVYCYYQEGENFYRNSADDIIEAAGHRVDLERRTVSIPAIERDDLAKLREVMASISAADDELQRRSPAQMYRGLLRADGRRVVETEGDPPPDALQHTVAGIRKANREQRDQIRTYWRDADPITPENPASPSATDFQVACGKLHGLILKRLGHVPNDATKYEKRLDEFFKEIEVDPDYRFDRYIAEVVTHFDSREFLLTALTYQDRAISKAEQYLTDSGRAITAFMNYATQAMTIMTVRHLFPRLDEVVPEDEWEKRVPGFLDAINAQREQYDTMFDKGRYKYDEIIKKYDEPTEQATAIARALLAKAGLKLKIDRPQGKGSRNGGKHRRTFLIGNLPEAEAFLDWKFAHLKEDARDLKDAWQSDILVEQQAENREMLKLFEKMTPAEQRMFMNIMRDENGRVRFAQLMKMGLTGQEL